ncbi:unnamed protein product [Fusarium graminearum]|uniref:Uncharacterized protein n=1 Tax=Gibberella zeae TaxID=5518 RepID=A0A4E9E7G8_GIBZA|nr:unnamed protein product [Fusarium graminearum]
MTTLAKHCRKAYEEGPSDTVTTQQLPPVSNSQVSCGSSRGDVRGEECAWFEMDAHLEMASTTRRCINVSRYRWLGKGKGHAGWGQSMALAFCSGRSKETCEGKARPGYAPIRRKMPEASLEKTRADGAVLFPTAALNGYPHIRVCISDTGHTIPYAYIARSTACAPVWAYSLALQVL